MRISFGLSAALTLAPGTSPISRAVANTVRRDNTVIRSSILCCACVQAWPRSARQGHLDGAGLVARRQPGDGAGPALLLHLLSARQLLAPIGAIFFLQKRDVDGQPGRYLLGCAAGGELIFSNPRMGDRPRRPAAAPPPPVTGCPASAMAMGPC